MKLRTQRFAILISFFGSVLAHGEILHLTDGTVIDGQLGDPVEVIIKTSEGARKIPFSLLPVALQAIYRGKPAEIAAVSSGGIASAGSIGGVATALPAVPASRVSSAVSTAALAPPAADVFGDEELAALAAEVSLEHWGQITAIGSFRDKRERRGAGGLVVTKAFNALEENWPTVYALKDPLRNGGTWSEQVERAKSLQERAPQFLQRRWLELFIKAGEAVAAHDSGEFALCVRQLRRSPINVALASKSE